MLVTNAGYLGDFEPSANVRFAVSTHDAAGAAAGATFDTADHADLWIPGQGTVLALTAGVTLNLGGGGNVVLFDINLPSLTPFADDPEDYSLILGPITIGLVTGIYQHVADFSIQRRVFNLSDYDRDLVEDVWNRVGIATSAPAYGVLANTALANFLFTLRQSASPLLPATGITVTAQRSIDGGAFGNCTNAVAEISAGAYKIDLSAADLNGARWVLLKFTGTGAVTEFVLLRLTP